MATDEKFGLVFGYDNRSPIEVIWPFGYSRDDAKGPAMVNAVGDVVAVVGDNLRSGGGMVAPGVWYACGGVSVVEP